MKHWIFGLIARVLSLLAGCSFVFVDAIMLLSAFGDKDWGARIFTFLLSLIVLLIGLNLIAHPLRSLISINYAVAVVIMIIGTDHMVLASSDELPPFHFIMVIYGALSIILAMMIFPTSRNL